MLANPVPLVKDKLPAVIDLFVPTSFEVTDPAPDIPNVSPVTRFEIVVKSPLATVVVPSYTLAPLRVTVLVLISNV